MTPACQKIVEKFREFGCRLPADDYRIQRIVAGEWAWCLRSKTDTTAHWHGSYHFVKDLMARWSDVGVDRDRVGDCDLYFVKHP